MAYDNNFRNNITEEIFDVTIKNTINWIKDNKDKFEWAKDPNAYEMTNLFLFASKYISEGKKIDISNVEELWNIRKDDFERCNISENNFVYNIVKDSYESAITGKALVEDSDSHNSLRMMAGIGLFIYQQKRDNNEIIYNNPQELLELLHCSKSLKQNHPDLFKKYAFQANIDRICEIQLNQEISSNIKEEIKKSKLELEIGKSNSIFSLDNYVLKSLLEDTSNITDFIISKEQSMEGEISSSPSSSYFYSLNTELAYAGFKKDNLNLGKDIKEICSKYGVDFEKLLLFSNLAKKYENNITSTKSDDLYEELQKIGIEYFNKKSKNTEGR